MIDIKNYKENPNGVGVLLYTVRDNLLAYDACDNSLSVFVASLG